MTLRSLLKTLSLVLCIWGIATVDAASTEPAAGEKLFALHVSRLLVDKCNACHGADTLKIKGGLTLTSHEALLAGGDTSSRVLVPGSAASSLLYVAVTRSNPDLEMPPKSNDRLTEQETWHIRDWINAGAPWPDAERIQVIRERYGDGVEVPTSGGLSDDWTHRRYQPENLWAYQPLNVAPVPISGVQNPIDFFIERKLHLAGLAPAPLADRRTLIRRATYDLLGLPPTPEEIEAFVNDPSGDETAFSALIDRLLASPHYGEQWGRHWLDVVRYADSSGFANDYERGNAWRYRDYVIRSFNEDKPYDQFVTEQIAGDELFEDAPEGSRNTELLVAAGFLRMGPWELTGMEVARIARQRFLDDVTDTVGQVFLGHPLQCARCHDHKFDPIPTRDYYGMQAVFATTQPVERSAAFLDSENTLGFDERRYLGARRKEFQENLKRLADKEEAAARRWAEERGLDYIARDEGLKNGVPEDKLAPKKIGFDVPDYGLERISRKGIEHLRWELDRYEPVAFSVYDGATPNIKSVNSPLRLPSDRLKGDLGEISILAGGDPFSPTTPVRPGALSVVNSFAPDLAERKIPDTLEGRRTALANWIVDPKNPLTTRVFVNRVWQWHFGNGIAANPNNLGATGKKPTHPELLDWLAADFVQNGHSIKSLHRVIMTSKAYRRSSHHPDRRELEEKDPLGTQYAVFGPRRISAEELRDSMLAVSGELNRAVGGIPNRPEINHEAAFQPRMVMGTFAAAWQPNPTPAQRNRRSIYALKIRGLRDPFMEVFNQPSPENSCEARETSTVTPQVFSLFNAQATYDRAVAFALKLTQLAESDSDTIRNAFWQAYGRDPSVDETQICLAHWSTMNHRHENLQMPKPEIPTVLVREGVEENTGEKFTFTETLRFYEDFVPDKKLPDVDIKVRGLAEVCLIIFNSNEFSYVY
ncbi:MAG: PSD1 and planctomycete cytochrome C domain-containing protein [Verrucomicrobia bacterium]|nr:PSD1 and planctomycete cytochrome C domain-containing protein [Verrucomicrobiota bacterium]